MTKRIIFRADGSSQIGLGHMYRLLSIVEIVNKSAKCVFVSHSFPSNFSRILVSFNVECIELKEIAYSSENERKIIDEIPFDLSFLLNKNDIVVLDGYWFGPNYQKEIKKIGSYLIVIDDLAEREVIADVIINHTPGFDISMYKGKTSAQIIYGNNSLLLRNDFFKITNNTKQTNNTLFISFGGASNPDFYCNLLKIIDSKHWELFEICVVGTSEPDQKKILRTTELKLSFYQNLNTHELINLIDKCSHFIVSSSTLALEILAREKIPLIGFYANNQKFLYKNLIKAKLAYSLGNLTDLDNTSIQHLLNYLGKKQNKIANIEKLTNEDLVSFFKKLLA